MLKPLNSVSGLLIFFPTLDAESFRQESNYGVFYVSSLINLGPCSRPEHISRLFARAQNYTQGQGTGYARGQIFFTVPLHSSVVTTSHTQAELKAGNKGQGAGDTPPSARSLPVVRINVISTARINRGEAIGLLYFIFI